jgi:hypothetical protein
MVTDVETALRNGRPFKVTALLDDDREVPVAVPRGPRRWQRMATTVASLPWVELRLMDKAGALLAAPVVRTSTLDQAAAPAAELEDLSGSRTAPIMVPVDVITAVVKSTLVSAMQTFTEVARVMRSSGSAEDTAALTANRETVHAVHALAADLREQLEQERARTRELEQELAARLADDQRRPPEEAEPKSASERLLEQFAGGFLGGAAEGAPKANKEA